MCNLFFLPDFCIFVSNWSGIRQYEVEKFSNMYNNSYRRAVINAEYVKTEFAYAETCLI